MDECKPLPPEPPGLYPVVPAQVEFEAKFESDPTYFTFKRLIPGAFNVGLTGSGQHAPPCPVWKPL